MSKFMLETQVELSVDTYCNGCFALYQCRDCCKSLDNKKLDSIRPPECLLKKVEENE